jgi:hypothetical protein
MKVWQSLALIFGGIVAGLLLAEGVVRLAFPLLPENLRYQVGQERFQAILREAFVNDEYLKTKARPDLSMYASGYPDFSFWIRTTSLGFNDIGFRDDGVDGTVLAVAVGDSFSWGDGVENSETWVEQLEAATGYDFVNLGVRAYGPIQYNRVLERYGAQFKPRVILWQFFLNDFEDSARFEKWINDGKPAKYPPPGGLDQFLRANSYTYVWLQQMIAQRGDGEEEEEEEDQGEIFYDQGGLHLRFKRKGYWSQKMNFSRHNISHGWELTQQAVLEADRLADEVGAELVVVLVPFKEQAYWPLFSTLLDHPERYEPDLTTDLMRELCDAHGVRYIDLTPVFQEHTSQGEQLYFRVDGHWNPQGQALAAQAVRDYLSKEGLLPGEDSALMPTFADEH